MAIELDTTRLAAARQTAAQDVFANATPGGEQPAAILGGKSVTVVNGAMTDLEKLVARLKNESENTRQSVAERRISILQTVLDSMADQISAAEKENLLKIEELNGQKSEAELELARLLGEKSAASGRINAMDIEIQALENAVERAVQDGADHRAQVAKQKAQRADDQAKIDRLDQAIASVTAKIAGLDVKIAECTKAIASSTLSEVAAALRAAAGDETRKPEAPETQAERDKQEAKALETDISRTISAALDKIDAEIRRALDEAQMKVEG